jgi:hypothetical protein
MAQKLVKKLEKLKLLKYIFVILGKISFFVIDQVLMIPEDIILT